MSICRLSEIRAFRTATLAIALAALTTGSALAQTVEDAGEKLDAVLQSRAAQLAGRSRVIVEFADALDVRVITNQRGRAGRRLPKQRLQVAEVDNYTLTALAADPRVTRVMIDRPAFPTLFRTGAAIGSTAARQQFDVTGHGIGIAVIDSGVTSWHNDLYLVDGISRTSDRIAHFKDFTDGSGGDTPSDGYGHGTHVSGILAGSGHDSDGARTGIAPGAHLIPLKVLDGEGHGHISDVIAALDYAVEIKDVFNVRVINLSVASGVFESYRHDPLAQAAKRAVDAGIVVVAAAGNLGTNESGEVQYGGITSPGNAPWVLTVGAASHQGTARRSDDVVSDFSSRGPTWIDFAAKPDLVAPGVGIESLSDPNSTLYRSHPEYLLNGTHEVRYQPYLSLSGTSMAAPIVTGTVALMLEANPSLTPNSVKAILQYTAQVRDNAPLLAQGAGLVNAAGALRMARFFAEPEIELGETVDTIEGEPVSWSRHIIWGNYRVTGGVPLPGSNAWTQGLVWGAMKAGRGAAVVWGARTVDASGTRGRDNIVWATAGRENIVWATGGRDNIVWATGRRENIVWATGWRDNIVWATRGRDNIVWATRGMGNIVWATRARDNIVWATRGRDNIVWATRGRDNIVWATAMAENLVWGGDCDGHDCQRTVWGTERNGAVWSTAGARNIVWATATGRNIVWATAAGRNIVWATAGSRNIVWATGALDGDEIVWTTAAPDRVVWPSDRR